MLSVARITNLFLETSKKAMVPEEQSRTFMEVSRRRFKMFFSFLKMF